jgi:hypothetical protein
VDAEEQVVAGHPSKDHNQYGLHDRYDERVAGRTLLGTVIDAVAWFDSEVSVDGSLMRFASRFEPSLPEGHYVNQRESSDPFIYVTEASTGKRSATRHLDTCSQFFVADDTGPSGRVWHKSEVRRAPRGVGPQSMSVLCPAVREVQRPGVLSA